MTKAMRTPILYLSCVTLASFILLSGCAPRWIERDTVLPDVMPREQWQAQPALEGMERHSIDRITIHHTAVHQAPGRSIEDKLQGLQQFSQREDTLGDGRLKLPWPDVPYHFYIDFSGRIAEARPLGYRGDTNTPYDPTGHAQIVLEGNFEDEVPTPEQVAALARLTVRLAQTYRVGPDGIGGHGDYATTLCPGRNLSPIIPQLRELVAENP
jgi:hypothetical protein